MKNIDTNINTLKISNKTVKIYQLAALLLLTTVFSATSCKRAPKYVDDDTDTNTTVGTDSDSGKIKFTAKDQDLTVFKQDTILEYHITIDESDLKELDEHGDLEVYKPASLHITGGDIDITFDKIGYRYKGAYSLHHCWDDFGGVRSYEDGCAKLSQKIKFSEYDETARLFGLKKLNLHSMSSDNSKLRDRLSYSLFNEFGVTAPRSAHAKVFVNGKYSGLFIAVEAVDGRFTAYRYPEDGDGDGNLYKEIWPVSNLPKSYVLEHLETNNSVEDKPDGADFIKFGNVVDSATETDFLKKIKPWIDIEHILKYMAVDRSMRNWDGVTGFYSEETPHNFYWYHTMDNTGVFSLIPWDLDNTFGPFDMYMNPQQWCDADPIPDWNVEPLSCDPRPGCNLDTGALMMPPFCDNLFKNLALTSWDSFNKIGQDYLDTVFIFEKMDEKITKWSAQIESAVDEDPNIDLDQWHKDVDTLKSILKDSIYDFNRHIAQGVIKQPVYEPLDETLLNDPITLEGFNPLAVNNFEFSDDTSGFNTFLTTSASTGSVMTGEFNVDSPLSGTGDFLLDVNFAKQPKAWDEWATCEYFSKDRIGFDLSDYTAMWIAATADKTRSLRISVRSPLYQSEYGGVWQEFQDTISISAEPAYYRIDLKNLYYPDWAKESWSITQGWSESDNLVRDEILKSVNGLAFTVQPDVSVDGEMTSDTDHAVIHIDNIYFQ
ncbi:MAG: CotH kinase family protein, partial [Deltaproteobacteria bacterium]|nr:CotH kinase family protein [Deltaproteobacteria bacterium]